MALNEEIPCAIRMFLHYAHVATVRMGIGDLSKDILDALQGNIGASNFRDIDGEGT